MNWSEFISIKFFEDSFISIKLGPTLPIFIAVILIVIFILKRKLNNWDVEESNIKLGGLGDIKIKPDYNNIQIAHKAWAELSTRKAGLPFDEKDDVILEVYDSWYKLFGEMRDLIKQVPSEKIRKNKDTQELIRLLIDSLNMGLRPHLTKWQARFRSWYFRERDKHPDMCPQELQRLFPKYKELISELKEVNKQMVEYTEFIKKIAHGNQGSIL